MVHLDEDSEVGMSYLNSCDIDSDTTGVKIQFTTRLFYVRTSTKMFVSREEQNRQITTRICRLRDLAHCPGGRGRAGENSGRSDPFVRYNIHSLNIVIYRIICNTYNRCDNIYSFGIQNIIPNVSRGSEITKKKNLR